MKENLGKIKKFNFPMLWGALQDPGSWPMLKKSIKNKKRVFKNKENELTLSPFESYKDYNISKST